MMLSEGTVRNHLSVAIQKLGVKNRVEAARLAERNGCSQGRSGLKLGCRRQRQEASAGAGQSQESWRREQWPAAEY